MSACPAPKEVSGEASEGHVLTQDIHLQLHSGSAQAYVPIVCLRSSIRLWCGVGWGWSLGVVAARIEVAALLPEIWVASVADLTQDLSAQI